MGILDPKGAIRHKQIGDANVGFDVEDTLTVLSSCKLPVYDQSAFEEILQPPDELPPPPPAPLPEESEVEEKVIKEEECETKTDDVEIESEVKIVVTQATRESLYEVEKN